MRSGAISILAWCCLSKSGPRTPRAFRRCEAEFLLFSSAPRLLQFLQDLDHFEILGPQVRIFLCEPFHQAYQGRRGVLAQEFELR